jgi:hypothetical protein
MENVTAQMNTMYNIEVEMEVDHSRLNDYNYVNELVKIIFDEFQKNFTEEYGHRCDYVMITSCSIPELEE